MGLRRGFTLKDWTVYPLEGRLDREGDSRRIQPKTMDVLLCLANARGEVVERDDMLRQVWGERWVSDEPLTRCISELRRALGDRPRNPEFILTVPKRGYQLLPEAVALVPEEPAEVATEPASPPDRERGRRSTSHRLLAALVLVLVAGLLVIGLNRFLQGPDPNDEAGIELVGLDPHAIAVLPFTDLSADGDQEYMSDGIAEEVLNLLTRVQNLRVISRSSSFSLKGQAVDISTVARRFDVAYVLEGSVRTSGNQLRITAQLIDARNDAHVWSETYDRELTDVFAIQEDIARAVVDRLEMTLRPGTAVTRETDPEAYALFLQARYLHEQPAGDAFQRAFNLYRAALAIDETYVPAWVWLAALYDDTVNSSDRSRDETETLMFEAIDRALAIDPEDPLALAMSAILLIDWRDDNATAVSRMQQALDLDPTNPIILRWAAIVVSGLGQHDEAARIAEYLFARDPVGNISRVNLASILLMAGRFEDAIRICEIQVASVEELGPCRSRLILAYLYAGRSEDAKTQLDLTAGSRVYTRLAPMVFFSLGEQRDFDLALADLLEAYTEGDVGMANWLAHTYTFVNDIDAAFDWLEIAHDQGVLDFTQNIAFYQRLHGDPRWPALLDSVGRSPEVMEGLKIDVRLPG